MHKETLPERLDLGELLFLYRDRGSFGSGQEECEKVDLGIDSGILNDGFVDVNEFLLIYESLNRKDLKRDDFLKSVCTSYVQPLSTSHLSCPKIYHFPILSKQISKNLFLFGYKAFHSKLKNYIEITFRLVIKSFSSNVRHSNLIHMEDADPNSVINLILNTNGNGRFNLQHRYVNPKYRTQNLGKAMLKLADNFMSNLSNHLEEFIYLDISTAQLDVLSLIYNHGDFSFKSESQEKRFLDIIYAKNGLMLGEDLYVFQDKIPERLRTSKNYRDSYRVFFEKPFAPETVDLELNEFNTNLCKLIKYI